MDVRGMRQTILVLDAVQPDSQSVSYIFQGAGGTRWMDQGTGRTFLDVAA